MASPPEKTVDIIEGEAVFARLARQACARPVLFFTLGAIAGICATPSAAWTALALGSSILFRHRRWAAVLLLGFALGGWRMSASEHLAEDDVGRLSPDPRPRTLRGEIVEVRSGHWIVECEQLDGARVRGRLQIRDAPAEEIPGTRGRFLVDSLSESWVGWRRRGIFREARCREFRAEEGAGWRRRWWGVRHWLRDRWIRATGRETGGFLAALIVGVEGSTPADLAEALRRTGTTHLLVISGMHFVLFLAAAGWISRICFFSRGWRWAAWSWTALYALLAIPSVPVVRAAVMAGLSAVAILLGRRPDTICLLSAAAAVCLAFDPRDLFNPGFQLSFAAVAALTYSTPLLCRAPAPVQAAGTSVACTLATGPIIAAYFGQFTPVAILANLILAPLFTALLFLGMAALFPGADLLAAPLAQGAYALLKVGGTALAGTPMAALSVPAPAAWVYVAIIGILGILLVNRRAPVLMGAALLIPILLVAPWTGPEPHAAVLRDGSGILVTAERNVFVIDPRRPSEVTRYLASMGIRRVDAILLREGRGFQLPGMEVEHLLVADEDMILASLHIRRRGEEIRLATTEIEWILGSTNPVDSERRVLAGDLTRGQVPPGAALLLPGFRLAGGRIEKFQ
jgi:ComEC/Rec2-related protein